MTYGDPQWQGAKWILPEEEAVKHIKFAYVLVSRHRAQWSVVFLIPDLHVQVRSGDHDVRHCECEPVASHLADWRGSSVRLQVYSHGKSEIILGNAIKQYNLPRDELVILTKVRGDVLGLSSYH